jgi:hypothetical protein
MSARTSVTESAVERSLAVSAARDDTSKRRRPHHQNSDHTAEECEYRQPCGGKNQDKGRITFFSSVRERRGVCKIDWRDT